MKQMSFCITGDNEAILALLSSCDLAHLSQAYKRISIFKFYLKSHFYEVASNCFNRQTVMKFYLDSGVIVNENSRILSNISGWYFYITKPRHNKIKSKKPTKQILEFTKTQKYQNFIDIRLKMANEILKHNKILWLIEKFGS